MSDASATDRESADVAPSGDVSTGDVTPRENAPRPWVTRAVILLCIGLFLGVHTAKEPESWENLARFGAPSSDTIWRGAWWALISCAFVHVALWHLAFNLYWLWTLGSQVERAVGSFRYTAFIITSAFISSGCELALTGATGIGASGVGYALFGFTWVAKERYPRFKEVLDAQTIALFVIWLLGCIVASFLNIASIGNGAHVSGLAFGAGVAAAWVLRWRRPLVIAGLGALAAIAILSLFWCPWSVNWLAFEAYKAHDAQKYELALERYTQLIARDPQNAWAYQNRSGVHAVLGHRTGRGRLEEGQGDRSLRSTRVINSLGALPRMGSSIRTDSDYRPA